MKGQVRKLRLPINRKNNSEVFIRTINHTSRYINFRKECIWHVATCHSASVAGFSFGAFVAAQAAHELPEGEKPERLVMVGPSTQKQQVPVVPANTVVVHGEADEVVPLSATFDWARPQALPVVVLPGVGHFFHGQLALLKNVVLQQLRGAG